MIWPVEQVVYARPRICPGEWDAQTSQGIWDTNRSKLGQTIRLSDSQQKKRTCRIVDFDARLESKIKRKRKER